MPWVRFTSKFDYHIPGRPVTLAFKAGEVRMVTTPCSVAAKAAGKAVPATEEERNEARSKSRRTAVSRSVR
jgi:hypothetical protein